MKSDSGAERAQVAITGFGVSPGIVSGKVFHLTGAIAEPSKGLRLGPREDHALVANRIDEASAKVKADLEVAAAKATSKETREVLEATSTIAADPTLVADARRRVQEEHLIPERAIWEAANRVMRDFEALGGYFAERVTDIKDIRDRMIAALSGALVPGLPATGVPYILVAEDLAPSVAASLDEDIVLAIVTDGAGPTSHTAIIAKEKGIPCVVAARGATETFLPGTTILVNGSSGVVILDPTEEQIEVAHAAAGRTRTFSGRGLTKDGHHIQLLANVGDAHGAQEAAAAGAEGIGLFRTEFCFLDQQVAPTFEEQLDQYAQVFAQFPGRKVVIRTLDSGADKPLPFMQVDPEENPALGLRGIRTVIRYPELLDTQLRAIAAAAQSQQADVWVMAPMISTVAETEDFVARCATHGLQTAGVMVEVPSAALLAGPILARAKFASIGTNDLTQYTMAADRLLGPLAELADPWQPAMLQLIEKTARGGAQQGRPVGICGEAASIPLLAVVLAGLGISSLSMTARSLPDVATALAAVSLDQARFVARLALDAESPMAGRAAVRAALPQITELGL